MPIVRGRWPSTSSRWGVCEDGSRRSTVAGSTSSTLHRRCPAVPDSDKKWDRGGQRSRRAGILGPLHEAMMHEIVDGRHEARLDDPPVRPAPRPAQRGSSCRRTAPRGWTSRPRQERQNRLGPCSTNSRRIARPTSIPWPRSSGSVGGAVVDGRAISWTAVGVTGEPRAAVIGADRVVGLGVGERAAFTRHPAARPAAAARAAAPRRSTSKLSWRTTRRCGGRATTRAVDAGARSRAEEGRPGPEPGAGRRLGIRRRRTDVDDVEAAEQPRTGSAGRSSPSGPAAWWRTPIGLGTHTSPRPLVLDGDPRASRR